MVMLTRKALLLFKLETTPGTDANPTAAADAVLVGDPTFTVEPNVLTRNFVSSTLSPIAHRIGRKLAKITFTYEFRSNGKTNSGLLADEARFGRMLQACGFGVTETDTAAERITDVYLDSRNDSSAPAITWAKGGTISAMAKPVLFQIRITTGGPSGTAQCQITNNNSAIAGPTQTGVTLTSGQPVSLGTIGAQITPTWTGNLVQDDRYYVTVFPVSLVYTPVSENHKTATLYLYLDGLLHKMTYGMGTFTIEAEAGNYGTMNFEFMGQYLAPVDATMPTNPVYETELPPVIELSTLAFETKNNLVVGSWSFDMANEIVPRPDVNSSDGYKGFRLVSREPKGGFTPESTLVAEHDFWNAMANGREAVFITSAGQSAGKVVTLFAPRTQISDMPYGDRNGIRTHEISMGFKRASGDDEVFFVFS